MYTDVCLMRNFRLKLDVSLASFENLGIIVLNLKQILLLESHTLSKHLPLRNIYYLQEPMNLFLCQFEFYLFTLIKTTPP